MTMNLNKLKHFLFLPLFIISFVACEDDVTYSDMKEKEVDAVNRFVKENGIKIISYEQFVANDSTTDVSKNEFVEIDDVYLQIVNNPKDAADARRIEDGDIIVEGSLAGVSHLPVIKYILKIVIDKNGKYLDSIVIKPFLKGQESNIDLEHLIATHPNADHVGGMKDVFNNLNVKNFIKVFRIYCNYSYF